MSKKIVCDECDKEINGNVRYQLKLIYREMDWGQELNKGDFDLCSKNCVLAALEKLDKKRESIEEKDRKGEHVY